MRDHVLPQAPTRSAPQQDKGRPRPARAAEAAGARGDLGPASASDMLALQRAAGNAAVAEAAGRHVHDSSCGHQVQRAAVQEVLGRPGKPLEPPVREEMEGRLGADFSDVRVHTDHAAHTAAESVQAHAFTSGSDIVFQHGRYDTRSTAGRTMLAHELTHVVQQRSGPVAGTETGSGLKVSDPTDRFEREAEATADRAMSGTPAAPAASETPAGPAGGGTVQRASAGAATKDTNEATAPVVGSASAMSVGSGYLNPNAGTVDALNAATAAPAMATMGSFAGLATDGATYLRERDEAKGAQAGTAAHRQHGRARNAAGGDTAQDGFNFAGSVPATAGGALKIAESGAADVVGGAGLGITLPAALLQGGRYVRKADHARKRADALAKVLGDKGSDDSELRTLLASHELAGALVEFHQAQKEWRVELQAEIRDLENRPETPGAAVPDSMAGFGAEIDAAFAPQADPAADLVRAELERLLKQTENVDDQIAAATAEKRRCDQILRDSIAAYAAKKNRRGLFKKATVATGSIATFLGGVAALVAAFAAGAAIGATPVGWALAGLGAALGGAIAAYKTSKYFGKRWGQAQFDEAGNERTTGDRLRTTLNVLKPLGTGKRELVANALWELAEEERESTAEGEDTSVAGVEIPAGSALDIIAALGLDWKAEKMGADRENAVALIAAKMAS